MADQLSPEEDVDVLEDDFTELAPVARGRRERKRTQPRNGDDEDLSVIEERKEDRRRRRRWDAPPHKRANDYDAG